MRDIEKYNEYERRYHLAQYRELKKTWIEALGGVCNRCGSSKNLEFDHIDPSTKDFTITMGWAFSKEAIEIELKKCQLLCKDCHIEKTISDRGQKPARNTHGTLSSYRYCKCDLCRKAKREYMRSYKRRR